jgi:hypothetical protein
MPALRRPLATIASDARRLAMVDGGHEVLREVHGKSIHCDRAGGAAVNPPDGITAAKARS